MPRALKGAEALRAHDSQDAAGSRRTTDAWSDSPRALAQRSVIEKAFGAVAQRKVELIGDAKRYEPPRVPSAIYKTQYAALHAVKGAVTVEEGNTGNAEGKYVFLEGLEGVITMPKPKFGDDKPRQRDTEFNSNVGTLTHEMQHALDDLQRTVRYRVTKVNVLHTEWRAWAIQAAVTLEHQRAKRDVTPADDRIMRCFKDKTSLSQADGPFFKKTALYLNETKVIEKPSDEQVLGFMRMHDDWMNEALKIFYDHVPEGIGGLDWDKL